MGTTITPSCNTASLAPYSPSAGNPWNTAKIKHVYKRLGFGATINEVDDALSLSPSGFIDSLVDNAINLPPAETPPWGFWSLPDFPDFDTENELYIYNWRLTTGNHLMTEGLRGRLSYFWMNHFVTGLETYFYAPYMFQYYNKMQVHGLGNFKDFTREIGKSGAMLLYLNGFENTNTNPNENYARELYELFTLGEGNNYTEQDITETAKALTGYNHWTQIGAEIYFDESTHTQGSKTIFNQEGPWNYDNVIDILFEQRATEVANTVCEKLYKYFVSPAVDDLIRLEIIEPLAQTLISNDWELVPMLKQLFKSEHFFDETTLGVVVKSPADVIFGFVNDTNFFYDDSVMDAFLYFKGIIGQEIYDPPDVSGWQRDESWINGSTLTGRWQLMGYYIYYLFNNGHEFDMVELAGDLSNYSNNPDFITQVIIDHFVSKPLHTAADYVTATDIFKWDVPQNYYDDGTWNLSWDSAPYQVTLLLLHLVQMPEFQLK